MRAYDSGALGDQPIALNAADRLIVIGSDGMMAAVAQARQRSSLKPYLKPAITPSPRSTRRCNA